VLGLTFLTYISDAFEERRQQVLADSRMRCSSKW
jgi:type I restriction-modification system DNA methylase subunit